MATAFVVWDRQDQKVVGPVFSTSANASASINRLPRHDGGKKSAVQFDILTVTI